MLQFRTVLIMWKDGSVTLKERVNELTYNSLLVELQGNTSFYQVVSIPFDPDNQTAVQISEAAENGDVTAVDFTAATPPEITPPNPATPSSN